MKFISELKAVEKTVKVKDLETEIEYTVIHASDFEKQKLIKFEVYLNNVKLDKKEPMVKAMRDYFSELHKMAQLVKPLNNLYV